MRILVIVNKRWKMKMFLSHNNIINSHQLIDFFFIQQFHFWSSMSNWKLFTVLYTVCIFTSHYRGALQLMFNLINLIWTSLLVYQCQIPSFCSTQPSIKLQIPWYMHPTVRPIDWGLSNSNLSIYISLSTKTRVNHICTQAGGSPTMKRIKMISATLHLRSLT